MSTRTTTTAPIPGLLNISSVSSRKSQNPRRKSKPVKGIFQVPLPFPPQPPPRSSVPPTTSLRTDNPKAISDGASPTGVMKIQHPSGRIARARAHRLAASSASLPSPAPLTTASPPPTPSPPTKIPTSPSKARYNRPPPKEGGVAPNKRDRRARTRGKEKYRREITEDFDMFINAPHAEPVVPLLPTPPTTPQRVPRSPPPITPQRAPRSPPPTTPPPHTHFSPSHSLRSSGSWERYANSTFQHSPSPTSIPRPKFMTMDMDVDEF